MIFFDFLFLLPELFLINATIVFFWVVLYLKTLNSNTLAAKRTKNSLHLLPWPPAFTWLSITILLIYSFLVLNTPVSSALTLNGWYTVSNFDSTIKAAIALFACLVFLAILSTDRADRDLRCLHTSELALVRLMLVVAAVLMVSSNNLLWLYFALELYAMTSYFLVGYQGRRILFSSEAVLKYFILSTVFSVLGAYAIALIYSQTGLVFFDEVRAFISLAPGNLILQAASIIFFSSIAFKLGVAPFHFWAPDLYEGAPTRTVFILSTIPKLALFAVLWKLMFFWKLIPLTLIIGAALISVAVGSVAGVYQKRIKRLLAFSMIVNNGLLILILFSGSQYSVSATFFFLLVYLLTLTGIFTIILSLRQWQTGAAVKNIWGLSNLFSSNKPLALGLSVLFFSSAGLPPLVGFLSKYFILLGIVLHGSLFYSSLLVVLLFTPLGVFYYIRLLKIMSFNRHSFWVFYKPVTTLSAFVISFSVVSSFIAFWCSGAVLTIITAAL